jgi:uncharacterized protein GlcG (DUF336 family)
MGLLAAELPTRPILTLEAAKRMAAAAETEARTNKWNVVIAIVDDGGHLLYLQRMDDAQLASIDIAQAKARTALLYKRETKTFDDTLAAGSTKVLGLPDVLPSEGGIPITVNGRIIGAIGVSGVQSPQDAQIGRAGIKALEN